METGSIVKMLAHDSLEPRGKLFVGKKGVLYEKCVSMRNEERGRVLVYPAIEGLYGETFLLSNLEFVEMAPPSIVEAAIEDKVDAILDWLASGGIC